MDSRRLFVSVDLDPALHKAVASVQAPFADIPGVRVTDPTQTHVTLKFLGEVDESRIDEVETALREAIEGLDIGSFPARFAGLGVFPEFEYISVIWIGVREGATAMTQLHEAIETPMVDLGFEPEGHEFTPHATIARMDHAAGKETVQELLRTRDPDVGDMEVNHVSLTESTLTADGPEYSTVEAFDL